MTSPRHVPKIAAHGGPAPDWLVDHTARNRHVLGPPPEVLSEWEAAGLALPDLAAIRRYRLQLLDLHLVRLDNHLDYFVDLGLHLVELLPRFGGTNHLLGTVRLD